MQPFDPSTGQPPIPPPPPPPPSPFSAPAGGSFASGAPGPSGAPMPSCYRHPDRPAGVVCQRCDRPICPQCMHQASVGFHCPECTKAGAQKVYRGPGAFVVKPIVTYVLMGINVGVFLLGLLLVSSAERQAYLTGDHVTSFQLDYAAIAKIYGTNGFQFPGGVADGEWYRIVTSGFVHFGILHLLLNMWGLWILGRAVEQAEGRWRMGLIYGVSLLAGSLGGLMVSPGDFGAGASGAIFGLMGALALIFRSRGIPLRNSPVLTVILVNLFFTFTWSGISRGAHIGGLIGGALAGWILCDLAPRPGIGNRVANALCIAVGVACTIGCVLAANAYSF
ncbi:MAG: rhomboid family intramembrane serine protease [Acidimicrobiales bacterium]